MGPQNSLVLVTGANGFVGLNLCRDLIHRGYRVRGMIINKMNLTLLQNLGVEVVFGDVSKEEEVLAALVSVDYVVNVAGKALDWGSYESFIAPNVIGPEIIVKQAHLCGVKKMVHISSVAIHGFGNHDQSKEDGPFYPTNNAYCLTKMEGEKIVLQYALEHNFPVSIVRPANVYGEYDTTTFVHMAPVIEKRQFPYINGGAFLTCPLYVGNLTDAIVTLLFTNKGNGESYIICDDGEMNWRDWVNLICESLQVKRPWFSLPKGLVRMVGYALEKVFLFFKIKSAPPVTIYRATQSTTNYSFSNKKMERDLSWVPPYSTRHGVGQMVKWYREERC